MELCNIRASADSLLSAEVFLYDFVGGGADKFSSLRSV